jgi:hypothetical protein
VVSSTPAARPTQVVVGISQAETKPPALRDAQTKIEPGTVIEFSGVPAEFTADPFMVV